MPDTTLNTAAAGSAEPSLPESQQRTFAELGLGTQICRELSREGLTQPFPIQAATIPDALAGKDVLGRAPTGSGKTLAFGLPMIARLAGSPSRAGHPRSLILAPTRELAAQIADRLAGPAAACGLRLLCVVGGVNIKRHITALAAPVDILVATPGRAEDLIKQKVLSLSAVEITALDEADHMADMGFIPQVTRLLNRTPANGQRLLFSATLDQDVQKLTDKYLHNPTSHSLAPARAAVETMTHYVIAVPDKPTRTDVAAALAARPGRTIMFVRIKYMVDKMVKKLRRVGIPAVGIHGDKSQNSRVSALSQFTDGSSPVLVATDIAARGIDVSGVDLVVHIDPPAEHKAYLHRAGRTARAGESGLVVTLMLPDQRETVEKLMKAAGVTPTYLNSADSEQWRAATQAGIPSGIPIANSTAPQNATSTASGNMEESRQTPHGRSSRKRGTPASRSRGAQGARRGQASRRKEENTHRTKAGNRKAGNAGRGKRNRPR